MTLYDKIKTRKEKIAVLGLGYVGLPLAVEFGKRAKTIGFDVNKGRIKELKKRHDRNNESSPEEIGSAAFLQFTDDPSTLGQAKFIIVAVPTPVNQHKKPDLSFVVRASEMVGAHLKKGSIVVFEPTVYPGVTEEICVPILEKFSKLKYRRDFKVGYSPERMNPGDKEHTVANIVKVVSGCDESSLEEIARIYGLIIKAGTFKAKSIMHAEAAKVIENTQRDLNIALMNELAIIFHKMGIDTQSVIEAAATKWNFIKMQPGLVGGHCIGVDPYYLTYKAEELGYEPQVILAGRRINDGMGKYVAEQTIKHMIDCRQTVKGAKVLVLGLSFKENVSDIRNTRVIDIVNELKDYGTEVIVCDPLVDKHAVKEEYGIKLANYDKSIKADAIVVAVGHKVFREKLSIANIRGHFSHQGGKGVVIDVKGIFDSQALKNAGMIYWRL